MKSIIALAIRLRISVAVLMLLFILGGLFAYVTIPKESSPSIEIPNIIVTTLYQGASPKDIESLVTQVIEQEIQSINGIEKIESSSNEGVSTINIEFQPDVSMDEANQRVREKVDLAKPDLPPDAEEPIVSEIDVQEFPIMNINLAADYSLARLKEIAEDLEDAFEGIPSVLEVDVIGGLEREVQVNVDLLKLQGYNLTFDDLIETLQRENANVPGGSVDVDHLNYLVRVNGQFSDPKEINDLVITAPGQTPVFVRDVAEVVFGFKDRSSYARLKLLKEEQEDGEYVEVEQKNYLQVITLAIKKRPGENILDTSNAVRKVLDEAALPRGTQVLITGDESKDVRNLIKDLENNIISGIIFVVAVLLFFLGVRNSILVGIAIPLSMFISFVTFLGLGYTLNFVILFSLIIALGMLVDNAVVIVENIYRFLEQGEKTWDAAYKGAGEVANAVTASTLTTVAAFVPMLWWPGIIGKFMSYMPLTLIVTLSSSLFVAIVINPVVTGYFARVDGRPAPSSMNRTTKILLVFLLIDLLVMIALTNPVTALVLVVAGIGAYAAHMLVMRHIASGFVQALLPRLVALYRSFLERVLQRDYSVRGALVRNALGLGSLAGAAALGFLALMAFGVVAQTAVFTLLIPAGVLAAIGLGGVLIHTVETILLGRLASVRVGFAALLLVGAALGLLSLSTPVESQTLVALLGTPVVVMALGLLGRVVTGEREHLILTDNRAKLMNSVIGGLLVILGLYQAAPTGVEFFPDTDPNQIRVVVTGPLGTNIEAGNRLATVTHGRVDELLEKDPRTKDNLKNLLVNVGVSGGGGFGGGGGKPERSVITMNLVEFNDRNEPSRSTLKKIRGRLEGLPSADLEITKDQQGPPTGPPVNIELNGPNYERIVAISAQLKGLLTRLSESGEVPGLVDIRDNLNMGRPEMEVRIDRQRAAQFGLNTRQIALLVRTAVNGTKASTFRDGDDEYDITVRLREEDRRSLESVKNLTILNEGQQIPLVAVADLKLSSGLGSIRRKDLQRVVTVSANAATGFNAAEIRGKVAERIKPLQAQLPPGYTMKFTGESEDQAKSFAFLFTALIIGGGLILMILIAQFNSLNGPVIIMVAVVLSLIGVLLGLLVTRTPFGLFTFIGIISLAGIVVNNNIVLIDYAMQLREQGLPKTQAIIDAGATRLRPVLLTAMTTVLGLIPLTFGINIDFVGLLTELAPDFRIGSASTQFWGPMGTAIISGLTFATFLTLVIVPVMYSLMDSVQVRLLARPAKRADDQASAPGMDEPVTPPA